MNSKSLTSKIKGSHRVDFRLNGLDYEKATREALRRGYKSPGLYAKALISIAITEDSNERIIDEVSALAQTIEYLEQEMLKIRKEHHQEQQKAQKFRTEVREFMAQLSMFLTEQRTFNTEEDSDSYTESEDFIDRYANRR